MEAHGGKINQKLNSQLNKLSLLITHFVEANADLSENAGFQLLVVVALHSRFDTTQALLHSSGNLFEFVSVP